MILSTPFVKHVCFQLLGASPQTPPDLSVAIVSHLRHHNNWRRSPAIN